MHCAVHDVRLKIANEPSGGEKTPLKLFFISFDNSCIQFGLSPPALSFTRQTIILTLSTFISTFIRRAQQKAQTKCEAKKHNSLLLFLPQFRHDRHNEKFRVAMRSFHLRTRICFFDNYTFDKFVMYMKTEYFIRAILLTMLFRTPTTATASPPPHHAIVSSGLKLKHAQREKI